MPSLQIRVSDRVRKAAESAAKRSSYSLSEWALLAMDIAACRNKCSPWWLAPARAPSLAAPSPDRLGKRAAINVHVQAERMQQYERSARGASLPLRTWAAIVLAQAAGVSDLQRQLARLVVVRP